VTTLTRTLVRVGEEEKTDMGAHYRSPDAQTLGLQRKKRTELCEEI